MAKSGLQWTNVEAIQDSEASFSTTTTIIYILLCWISLARVPDLAFQRG
jgi:hypothetical protein